MNTKQSQGKNSETPFKLLNGEEAKMKIKPIFAFAGGVEDEPIGITIVPSGWLHQYHVIVEFGDSDDWNHYYLDKEQILQKFGIEVPDMNLKKMLRENPNDMTLGKLVRTSTY